MLDHLYAKFDKAYYAGLCKTIAVGEITTYFLDFLKVLLGRACAPSVLRTLCVLIVVEIFLLPNSACGGLLRRRSLGSSRNPSLTYGGEGLRYEPKECLRKKLGLWAIPLIYVLLFGEFSHAECGNNVERRQNSSIVRRARITNLPQVFI